MFSDREHTFWFSTIRTFLMHGRDYSSSHNPGLEARIFFRYPKDIILSKRALKSQLLNELYV